LSLTALFLSTVAVAGLPRPRDDHAVLMAKFAKECMAKMKIIVRFLELTLGPVSGSSSRRISLYLSLSLLTFPPMPLQETGDLSMRMGLHR
jgi:hypothetical protein